MSSVPISLAQRKFPEVRFEKETPGLQNPNPSRVSGIDMDDDDGDMNFSAYVARKGLPILLNYGYRMRLTVMTDQKRPRRRKTPKT